MHHCPPPQFLLFVLAGLLLLKFILAPTRCPPTANISDASELIYGDDVVQFWPFCCIPEELPVIPLELTIGLRE